MHSTHFSIHCASLSLSVELCFYLISLKVSQKPGFEPKSRAGGHNSGCSMFPLCFSMPLYTERLREAMGTLATLANEGLLVNLYLMVLIGLRDEPVREPDRQMNKGQTDRNVHARAPTHPQRDTRCGVLIRLVVLYPCDMPEACVAGG